MSVHDPGCPMARNPLGHSTAAKHAADAVNLHVAAIGFDAVGKWVAVRLADGRSDGTLYDSRQDAVRHQSDERLCAYARIHPGGMRVCEAESFLITNRKLDNAGFRLVDPDDAADGRQVIPALMREQHAAQLASLRPRR